MSADVRYAFWLELGEIMDRGFTGSIVLHVGKGRVIKYELNEVKHPKNGTDRFVDTKDGTG